MKIDDYFLDKLVEVKPRRVTLTAEEMENYRTEAERNSCGIVDMLVKKGIIKSIDVAHAKAEQFGCEFVNLKTERLDQGTLALIPTELVHKYRVVPIGKTSNAVRIATANPSDLDALDTLCHVLGTEIEIKVVSEEDIDATLRTYYPLSCDGGIEDVR